MSVSILGGLRDEDVFFMIPQFKKEVVVQGGPCKTHAMVVKDKIFTNVKTFLDLLN
jgi:hypothetical protein